MKPLQWKFIPLVVFIVLSILFFRGLELDPRHLPSARIGKHVPQFSLTTLDDGKFQSSVLTGDISLLNVWASWCMSCADEQLTLMQLKNDGVNIFGLNYKDTTKNAKQWLNEWGNPYKQIGEDFDGKVAMNMGVYGAPETFLIDKNGIIQYRHVGPMTLSVWQKEFLPKIKLLEGAA